MFPSLVFVLLASPAVAEPDHEIHEALRAVLREAQSSVNEGEYERLLPLLTADFAGTSITQEVITGREGVTAYFGEWFGPDRYLKSMNMQLEADELTDLSDDLTWGFVRGKGVERYVANEGYAFDFETRWTAVMVKGDDGRWRIRAVHIGTNHLDNPVLTRVKNTLIRNGAIAAGVALLVGVGVGLVVGRRSTR